MSGDGSGGEIPRILCTLAKTTTILLGGVFTIAAVSGATLRFTASVKQKNGMSCGVCRGIGYYTCKLCKGNSTIQWSPLYDPVVINPCLCPTCDGNKIQRCLNCLGMGST